MELKTTNPMKPKRWLFVSFLLGLCGCASQIASLNESVRSWIGHPINELKEGFSGPSVYDKYKAEIGWKDTTYALDNGNWVYVYLYGKDCFVHLEVNPQGIIVGAKTQGKGCGSYRYPWESPKSEFP